jgi:hypothetical protein
VLTSDSTTATFRGVETGQATLSMVASDADIPLGSSTAYDVDAFTHQLLNAMDPSPTYTHTLSVPIVADESDGGSSNKICTVELKITYTPSKKDQREELYEMLNSVARRKSEAKDTRRKEETTLAMSRSSASSSSSPSKPATAAVPPGFLNKKKGAGAGGVPGKLKLWYKRVVAIVPVVKNYVIFGAFCIFCQYHGHNLAIPAPV